MLRCLEIYLKLKMKNVGKELHVIATIHIVRSSRMMNLDNMTFHLIRLS